MRTISKLVLLILLCALGVKAQTTTVNLSVTDTPDGQTWNNGTYSTRLVPSQQTGGPPFFIVGTTTPVGQNGPSGTLSGTGTASFTITLNNQIAPAGSTWSFTVCPFANLAPCFTQQVSAVTPGSQTVALTPPSIRINLMTVNGASTNAYADSEITSTPLGGLYFNITSGTERQCTVLGANNSCTTWSPVTGSAIVPNPLIAPGDAQFAGPNPYVDIRAYGARAVIINTTGTGSGTSLTVGSSSFVNGDGITIVGGGAAPTMGTPSAPTVATGETESETQPDAPIAAGATGSSTYNYLIVARDPAGGLTLPSSATTITNGPTTTASNCTSSIGEVACTISTLSLSGNTITVVTTANNGLVQNAIVHITGTTNNAIFGGWFPVASITNGTTFTIVTPYQFSSGTATATGGQLVYFVANKITWTAVSGNPWEYFICAKRPGDSSYNIIGTSFPTTSNYTALQFDDWGSTLSSNPVIPWYVTSSICTAGSASNDNFTTKVSAGGGTTSLTLNAALTNSVSGAAVRLDNIPALQSAYNAATTASGSVYVPTGSYVLNSQSLAFNKLNIIQAGDLVVNDTINLFSSVNITGQGADSGQVAFGFKATPQITCNAYPCIIGLGQNGGAFTFQNVTLNVPANGLGILYDSGFSGGTLKHVNFNSTGGNNDNMGIGLMIRPGGSNYDLDHVVFDAGPNQVIDQTWTPYFYADYGVTGCCGGAFAVGQITLFRTQWNRRGFLYVSAGGSGIGLKSDWDYRQGGITPQFVIQNTNGTVAAQIEIGHVVHDTESQAALAIWGGYAASAQFSLSFPSAVSADAGTIPPQLTGGQQFGFTPPCPNVGVGLTPGSYVGFTYCNGSITATSNSTTQLVTPAAPSPRNVMTSVSAAGVPGFSLQQQCYNPTSAGTSITTAYTVQSSDFACTLQVSNGASITVPDANSTGFQNGFDFSIINIGTASVPVARQTSSTFNILGGSSAATSIPGGLAPGSSVYISQQGVSTNWNVSLGGSGSGGIPQDAFYITTACGGKSNCLQMVDDNSTDNCGAALTSFLSTINSYAGPGKAQVFIEGSGTGKAYKLATASCNLSFGGSVNVAVHFSATINCAQPSGNNCMSLGPGLGTVSLDGGGVLTGGANLANACLEIVANTQEFVVDGLAIQNCGATNATLGNCTNYGLLVDSPLPNGVISHVQYLNTSAGTCGFANPNGAATGVNTVIFRDNSIAWPGNVPSGNCGSIGILDGGSYGEVSGNVIYGAGMSIRVQGIGHRIISNEIDSANCTAKTKNAAVHFGGNGSSTTITGVDVADNIIQGSSGHTANVIVQAGDSTAGLSGWTVHDNINTTNFFTNGALFDAFYSCAVGTSSTSICYVAGNSGFSDYSNFCNNAPGWQDVASLGACQANTAGNNVAATTLLSVPNFTTGNMASQASCEVILVTAATTSSTLPQCQITYTDADSNTAETVTVTPVWASGTVGCGGSATNTVGNVCHGTTGTINPKANTPVKFQTINYASVGATSMVATVRAVIIRVN